MAETALAAATEPDIRAAAQASLDEARLALAQLGGAPAEAPEI